MNFQKSGPPGHEKSITRWIPSDWGCLPFGKMVVNSQYGLSYPASADGNCPIIGMSQMNDGKISTNDLSLVKVSKDEFEAYRIREGDFIFNRTNSAALVGKSAVAKSDMDVVFASYLVRFRIDQDVALPRFVGCYFSSSSSLANLAALATPGVSQYNINPTTLQKHFWLPVPPIKEQYEILQVIESWDTAIDKTIQLIEAEQELKKGLAQQLLTGKRRFPDFDGQKWREYRLGEVFTERREANREDLPLLSITADRGLIPQEETAKKDTSNSDKSNYKRIAPGDIGYNTMRMWQGVSVISHREGIVSPAYTICIPGKMIDAHYAKHLFKFTPMIHIFWRYSQGLVDDTLSLKFHKFSQIHVELPPFEEQRKIAATLDVIDDEIKLLEMKLDELREQKKGLMQKLLTGKVRVMV